jgi:DNA-binding PadR family transcriptional regulator
VSLRHALLVTLLSGAASGYELSKRFDASTASFWPARRQQIYAELKSLEADGLVAATVVQQAGRPDRRDCSITAAGRQELARWVSEPAAPNVVKDELLVKLAAAELVDVGLMIDLVSVWRGQRAERLAVFEQLEKGFLRGKDRETYLRTARRVGPYLTLERGLEFERANIAWADNVVAVLLARGRG